jgi:Arm domain-containing DNA-binding protein
MARLTVRSVETLRPSIDRREIPDDYMAGLYCVLQPSGAKSWAVRYRHQGVSRKLTLGSYPALGLKDARELAAKALRTVAEGRDPGREKILARAAKADSVDRVVEDFLERCQALESSKNSKRDRAPASQTYLARVARTHAARSYAP